MNDIRDLLPDRMRGTHFPAEGQAGCRSVWQNPSLWSVSSAAAALPANLWAESFFVCPNCGYHIPIGGYYRLSLVLDDEDFRELDAD